MASRGSYISVNNPLRAKSKSKKEHRKGEPSLLLIEKRWQWKTKEIKKRDNCLFIPGSPRCACLQFKLWANAVNAVRWHHTHCTRRSRWSPGGPRQRTSTARRSPRDGKWGSPSWPLSAFQPAEEWKPKLIRGWSWWKAGRCIFCLGSYCFHFLLGFSFVVVWVGFGGFEEHRGSCSSCLSVKSELQNVLITNHPAGLHKTVSSFSSIFKPLTARARRVCQAAEHTGCILLLKYFPQVNFTAVVPS